MPYAVHLTTDKNEIHAFLRRDPVYAAYAIGDLEPALFSACTWYLAQADGEAQALALLFAGLQPPVLLTLGEPAAVQAIFDQAALPAEIYMNALCPHLPTFQARYDFSGDRVRPILRMAVTAQEFRPVQAVGLVAGGPRTGPHPGPHPAGEGGSLMIGPVCDRAPAATTRLRRLDAGDVPAIQALYGHGGPFAPDAFSPAQMRDGVFFGLEVVRLAPVGAENDFIAIAGTHLVAPGMGVAAVGNIYTHPAHRGRGYSQWVTSAVTADLLAQDMLVVLNVDQTNTAAIHVYEKLGYRVHGPFVEGIGVMRNA